jgi:probable rRNA maturation factor
MAMSNNRLDVLLDDERWSGKLPDVESYAVKVFDTALDYVFANGLEHALPKDKPIVINLSLNNNAEVQALNAEFRGKDKPTNVLSFANMDDETFWDTLDEEAEVQLGDIIVALETLEDEAAQKHISLAHHFAHLLVHGILHLCGYDHQTDDEADEMEGIEIKILQGLQIENPYEE